MDEITNEEEIDQLKDKAKFFWPDAGKEKELLRLIELQKAITKALDEAKYFIMAQGKKTFGDNFKGITGEHVKVSYNKGRRNLILQDEKEAKDFIKTEVKVDSDAVKLFEKSHDKLPSGIIAQRGKEYITIREIGV